MSDLRTLAPATGAVPYLKESSIMQFSVTFLQ